MSSSLWARWTGGLPPGPASSAKSALADAESRAANPGARDGLQRLDKLEQEAARAIEGLAQRVEAVAARLEAP